MARHRLKNRTFEEVAEGVFAKAKDLQFPKEVISRGRDIARRFNNRHGNRSVMTVSSLFIASKEKGMDTSISMMGKMFGHCNKGISTYAREIDPGIDLQSNGKNTFMKRFNKIEMSGSLRYGMGY